MNTTPKPFSLAGRCLTIAATLVCVVLIGPKGQAQQRAVGARDQISLAGAWQTLSTQDATDAVPTAGWKDGTAPSTTYVSPVGGSHFVWYRRDVLIPADWRGRRVFLDFHGARYAPCLFIDGKLVASQFNGFAPFKTEITRWARPGKTAQIAIRCQDRTALYKDGFVLKDGASEKGQVLAPDGGYKNFVGLWDEITLSSTPPERLDEDALVITPSTRRGTLTVYGTTDSKGADLWAGGRVLDGAREVLTLPPVRVAADGAWTLRAAFPNARDWSPEDPHLYTLELSLSHGQHGVAVDTLPQRFGFKEIWTQGPNFYLNGVKRHLLASAAWPIGDPEPAAAIDAKVRAIRAGNTVAFRLHNQIWPEEWLRAADEAGLLIVDETPLYTDGDGSYAYTAPRFWANYRDQIAGMIRRDRNHASLALWSLENETLFMNNQQYDAKLPQQLGDVGRYAKTLDPSHPITFEADQDPDGAADVIGLHYPHEMPWVYDYPNTADWLGTRTVTQAAGGMLGKRSTGFFWERKKPLYIGEYLWVPQQDYSVGSIYFGDRAYLNKDKFHARAQLRAFYDQTLGYRRSGVSGMCPWSVFGFGGVIEDPDAFADEREYYTPVAAFPRNRGFRRFGGTTVPLRFDVFSDDGQAHHLVLRLMRAGRAAPLAQQALMIASGDYRPVTLTFPTPAVTRVTIWNLHSVLLADGKPVHERSIALRLYPRLPLRVPAGTRLVAYDPSGRWPGSVPSLDVLKSVPAAHTVLLVAPGAFGTTKAQAVTTITGPDSKTAPLQAFLRRGGRTLVLDQDTLRPLGLDLELVDHASTMTFPLRPNHPLFAGLTPDDLSYWGSDNYVTKREVRRPDRHGARAVSVSGGPDGLGQSPIVESPVGAGWVVVVQALVAEKRGSEPAAQRLLQNAVNYLAALPPSSPRPVLVAAGAPFTQKLSELGLAMSSTAEAGVPRSLILDGGGFSIKAMALQVSATLRSGGTVYWHAPDPAAFIRLRQALGADGLTMTVAERGASLRGRENPLLSGVSREDLTYTSVPSGWDRQMSPDVHASSRQFLPTEGASAGTALTPDSHKGDATTYAVTIPTGGLYRLTLTADGTASSGEFPLLRVDVNGVQSSWVPLSATASQDYVTLVDLAPGRNLVAVSLTNGGGGRQMRLDRATLLPAQYPAGMDVLALPGALVTWRQGGGRVVLDGLEWDINALNAIRGARYASALFSGLGLAFVPPNGASAAQPIPLSAFELRGDSPYFAQSPDEIALRSNGLIEAPVKFVQAGRYRFTISGYSTPCQGVYAQARVTVDGKDVGTVEVKSPTARSFDVGVLPVTAGPHTIGLAFTNDASAGAEDRNLFVRGVSVTAQ